MQKFLSQIQPQRQLQQVTKQGTDGDDSIVFKKGEHGTAKTGKGFDVITIMNGAFADLSDWDNYDALDTWDWAERTYDKIKFEIKDGQKLYEYKQPGGNIRYLGVLDESGNVISGAKIIVNDEHFPHERNIFDMKDSPTKVYQLYNLANEKAKNVDDYKIEEAFGENIESGILKDSLERVTYTLKKVFEADSVVSEKQKLIEKELEKSEKSVRSKN